MQRPRRRRLIYFASLTALLCLGGCSKAKKSEPAQIAVEGKYSEESEITKQTHNVRSLEILKGGRWNWYDMMSGFSGTWTRKDDSLTLNFEIGPAGKLAVPESVVAHIDKDGLRMDTHGTKIFLRRQ